MCFFEFFIDLWSFMELMTKKWWFAYYVLPIGVSAIVAVASFYFSVVLTRKVMFSQMIHQILGTSAPLLRLKLPSDPNKDQEKLETCLMEIAGALMQIDAQGHRALAASLVEKHLTLRKTLTDGLRDYYARPISDERRHLFYNWAGEVVVAFLTVVSHSKPSSSVIFFGYTYNPALIVSAKSRSFAAYEGVIRPPKS